MERSTTRGETVVARLKGFWQGLSDGLSVQQLWDQFERETRQSYRIYTSEIGPRLQDLPPRRRWLRFALAIGRAMVLKLSPPRRICLLAAVLLILYGYAGHNPFAAALGTFALLALLGLELADRVAMKRDLQIAREIQSWLVPRTPPRVEGADVAFATRPANTVAGDYYDAFVRRTADGGAGGPLLLVVADVAGKGMPAALLMATFQSSLRTLVHEPLGVAELMPRLNRYCCDHSLDGRRFTTAVVAQLEPASGALVYVNAGHNPPALRRADGRIETLTEGGLPLGVQAGARYGTGALTLAPGDLLLIYTDGVVEARNPAGEEYGEARLEAFLRETRQPDASATLGALMASVDQFTGAAARLDDVTCLVVRRTTG